MHVFLHSPFSLTFLLSQNNLTKNSLSLSVCVGKYFLIAFQECAVFTNAFHYALYKQLEKNILPTWGTSPTQKQLLDHFMGCWIDRVLLKEGGSVFQKGNH